ncbi:MAG: hypothetical protein A2Y77_06935 [Planctomycetes bacterium RBG_13_62_9]|nr:MAG: hypothetical protein A2Y77_06935 [Planctomycetes bacterium RBG_13_62_9]
MRCGDGDTRRTTRSTNRKIRNPKPEIRSKSKIQKRKTRSPGSALVWNLELRSFVFVSDFKIRISSFHAPVAFGRQT